VHTSTLSAEKPYSTAVFGDPALAEKFILAKVSFLPLRLFTNLDRHFLSKVEPLPHTWIAYSGELAKRAVDSPPAVAGLQLKRPTSKSRGKRRRGGSSSPDSSSSSTSSEEEDPNRFRKEARRLAKIHKVRIDGNK
jgi:hypothetical protein